MTEPPHQPAEPILEGRSLHKTYRLGRVEVPVLKGASVSIERGEWVAMEVVGMGRQHQQWARAVARAVSAVRTKALTREREAIEIWLQYRATAAEAVTEAEGAYPCSGCRRWWAAAIRCG